MTPITLRELNLTVREAILEGIPDWCWVTAEIHEMHLSKGHCYMELVEKSPVDHRIVAKSRAMIWADANQRLQARFASVTGRPLNTGMQVLLQVEVSFHEVFGISLIIRDIDPSYTLGGMEREKQEIIARLQDEGIWDINRSLAVPEVIQRIAVIASSSSAGYGDFVNQLTRGHARIAFRLTLFPAIVQGNEAVASVCSALDAVNRDVESFDVVVIIRGGGSQADMHCFNTYEIASAVAQFPLPVITGIGHDRDTSVTDMVAAVALKTPTAVAEYIASGAEQLLEELLQIPGRMETIFHQIFTRERQRMDALRLAVVPAVSGRLREAGRELDAVRIRLRAGVDGAVHRHALRLQQCVQRAALAPAAALSRARQRLELADTKLRLLHPDRVLARGYALVRRGGRCLSRMQQISAGDALQVEMYDGTLSVNVTETTPKIK
ncbi:MAG: exodeoxyribonuclease VII large subunit [Bacteroidales bacterium]|nr:exodeoxyribonuclease VII large subunit [Bacteroidales bacterium]